jgi:5-formyltetrahydrofolate cyclo-ligase
MNDDSSHPRTKRTAREAARERRAALPADARSAQSAAIHKRVLSLPEVQAAKSICVYVSFRDEAETHELVRSFLTSETTVTVPKIVAVKDKRGRRIEAHTIRSWSELEPGAFGILEPRSSEVFNAPIDICLAPGLAFTERGDRLGYGRGHYDEFLARRREMMVIGLAFECQIVAEIPTAAHDLRMQMIITPDRVVQCERP